LFAWSNALISSSVLDPDIVQTLLLKANYIIDARRAKNDLVVRPDCPDFPNGLWIDVLLNRYVDLNRVYAKYYALNSDTRHTQSISDVDITLNHTGIGLKTNKSIKMHGEWAIAFAATKAAVLYAYPHRSREFSEYEKFIVGQFSAFVDPSQHQ